MITKEKIINSLELVTWIVGGLIAVGAVIGGIAAMFAPSYPGQPGGFLFGLFLLFGGLLYAVLLMGMVFVYIGTYQNTKRTAELLEQLNNK